MTYSGTVFGVYPIMLIALFLVYYNDKFMLLNFHQRSKQFDEIYHMNGFIIFVPTAMIFHIFGSYRQFKAWHQQMLPFYEKGEIESSLPTVHLTFYILIIWFFIVFHFFKCFQSICNNKTNSVDIKKEIMNIKETVFVESKDYLREIPIKCLREYYLHILKQIDYIKKQKF